MTSDQRAARLSEDLRVLEALRDESTIFDFVADSSDPPESFTLVFQGKGVRRDRNASEGYAEVDEHRCELSMGYGYPERPPELRWLTPSYHPNISYSGFISLKDLGLPWDKAVSLDVVCERLWDTARLAYYDLNRASNYNAKNWLESEVKFKLPIDGRPLRDGPSESLQAGSNVVRYERRTGAPRTAAKERRLSLDEPVEAEDVFFIEDEGASIQFDSPRRGRRTNSSDDGIMFIE